MGARRAMGVASVFSVLCLGVWGGAAAPPVGYEAFSDPDRVFVWTGLVKTGMSSSADRTGGNWDMSNFHGEYKGEKILAEIEGPGAIYRVWSAAPSGHFRVYLDGGDRPVISCPFKDYLAGTCEGLPGSFTVGRWANYLPITFARGAIVTAPGFRFPGYYQVSYQTYSPEVKVATFSPGRPAPESATRTWGGGPLAAVHGELRCAGRTANLAAWSRSEAIAVSGAGVIRSIFIRNPDDPSDPLKDLRLYIYWDGEGEAAVSAPVDAFFMNRFDLDAAWPGGGLSNFYMHAGKDGYASYFPMPFGRGFRIELSTGGAPKKIELAVRYEETPSLEAGAMRFHALYQKKDYRADLSPERAFTMAEPINPATNYVVLEREGTGHYVGTALFVKSEGTLWWGEGDEMTWVDGEDFPSIRGTGTEDEFNWSWGFEPHLSAVSGTLPVAPPCEENRAASIFPWLRNPDCNRVIGHNIAYRLRPTDYVTFTRSIKVSYEILGHSFAAPNSVFSGNLSQHRGDDYESVAYWYEVP